MRSRAGMVRSWMVRLCRVADARSQRKQGDAACGTSVLNTQTASRAGVRSRAHAARVLLP